MNDYTHYIPWGILAVLLIALLLSYKLVIRMLGMVIIPNNGVGIVTKKFSIGGKGANLPNGKIIALNNEAGIQADTLSPGLHFGLFPWQFAVSVVPFTIILDGKLGIVDSRDGQPIQTGRVLAKRVDCDSFQDARAFLTGGGQRGPQIAIIPPGSYRINTGLFSVAQVPALEIAEGTVGVVTTKDGDGLPAGEIAGKIVAGHKSFQDGEAFIEAGGYKGMQEQVILAGRYFINPYFATVEAENQTSIPIASVGVVIAYVGDKGENVGGDDFKHGNLVERGNKGVWREPLDPGLYPINPRTHKVEIVPTANIVLNWADSKTEAHNLDKNLSTITARSGDGFTFNLDVAQIIHIQREDAPKVIAAFGTMMNLVSQVLEPTIGNYFRNAAQTSDAIDFLNKRTERQAEAKTAIGAALASHNVGAVDTLIGDITPPAELMKTLTDRKIAQQQKLTYNTQQEAQEARKALEQATAVANTQARVVDAERKVQIADFDAQSAVKTADGAAKATVTQKTAEAAGIKLIADATAEQTSKVGDAEADVIRKKSEAVTNDRYVSIEVAKSIAMSQHSLVPQIVAGGEGESGSGQIVNLLLAQMLKRQELPNGA